MSGACEFSDPSNSHYDYDYEYHYDYDYDTMTEEDKDECLQSCLEKSRSVSNAAGCYFEKDWGQCVFLKTGTIVGSSGDSKIGSCWKFH